MEFVEQAHLDEIMRGVQGASDKTQVDRFSTVPAYGSGEEVELGVRDESRQVEGLNCGKDY